MGRFQSEFERLGGGAGGAGGDRPYDSTLPYDDELTELGTEDSGLSGDLLNNGGHRAVYSSPAGCS